MVPLAPSSSALKVSSSGGTLYVANARNIAIYRPPYTSPNKVITTGVKHPTALAVAPNGTIFALNDDEKVVGYTPPYTAQPLHLGRRVAAIATDAHSDLLESSFKGGLSAYAPGYSGVPVRFARGLTAFGLYVDPNDDLFASGTEKSGAVVEEFRSPYTGAPVVTITDGLQGWFGVPFAATEDGDGNLFVAISGGNNSTSPIIEYAPPFTGSPKTVIYSTYWTSAVAIGAGQTLIELNCGLACSAVGSGAGNVSLVKSPYTGRARRLHAAPGPSAMALGPDDTLFVLDGGEVRAFSPPYRGKPRTTIGNGIDGAGALAVTQ